MKKKLLKYIPIIIFFMSIGFHLPWLKDVSAGTVPGPVDPFLKIIQGFSLLHNNFADQSLYYRFKNIDSNYEFCTFQNDIFSVRFGDNLLGPFPIALSSFIALALKFLTPDKVFYVFVILNFFLYFLIYKSSPKSLLVSILIFFGLPFFIPNSEVSEHAILIILQVASLSLFISASFRRRISSSLGSFKFFISGILLGLGLFFRHEVLIFGNFFLATILFLKITINRKKIFWKMKDILYFALGLYLAFLSFFTMNEIFYGTFLGPRITANSGGIFSDLLSKFGYYKVILWKSPPHYGFFGYNPVYFITIAFLCFFRKKLSGIDLALLLPSLGLFLVVPILAPNDGGAPWGPRYLFLAIYPMVFLTARCLVWMRSIKKKSIKSIVIILFLIANVHSVLNERKGIRAAIDVAKLQSNYIKETSIQNVDLIIFTNELIAMQTGLNYIYYPIVLVDNASKIKSFEEKFLSQDSIQSIALIEPKTSHLNLNHFTDSEKKGLQPTELINQFDRLLQKESIEEKNIVKIHLFRKKIGLGIK